MDLSWILLGLIGWALGLLVLLILMRMAGAQDRAARHAQKRLDPFSEVTITQRGELPKEDDSTPAMSDCTDRHSPR
jgi:hypothetical protein